MYLLYRSNPNVANAPSEVFGPPLTRLDDVLYVSLGLIALVLFLPVFWHILESQVHKRVGTSIENPPVVPDNFQPLANALRGHLRRSLRRISPATLRKMIDRNAPKPDGRGTLITACDVDIPPKNEKFFEPYIVPPSQRFRGLLIAITAGTFIAGCALLLEIVLIGRPVNPMRLFMGLLSAIIGLSFFIILVTHHGTIDYVRIAPGIVQFIRFPLLSGRRPKIRSYSTRCGDTFMLTQFFRVRGLAKVFRSPCGSWISRIEEKYRSPVLMFVFVGSDQTDKLTVPRVKDSDVVLAKILDAITSTAKTPPLPEFELVG
jgi:hypothetical protein